MKCLVRIIFVTFCSLSLMLSSGCGFHLRGTQNLPPQLHKLYLDIDKPDAPFSQAVRNLLLSMHIVLVSAPTKARYILRVRYEFTHSTPNITSSTQTVSYNFRLRVKSQIENDQGTIVVPTKSMSVSHSLIMNSNEIYIPNTATFVEEEIGRDVINLLYSWLTNKNTHDALKTYIEGLNASTSLPLKPPLLNPMPVTPEASATEPSAPPSAQVTQENFHPQ